MDPKTRQWLDREMKDFAAVIREFHEKVNRMMYLWMAASVIGLTALGFYVSGDFHTVLTIHLPIGCGFALFIWLCFLIQNKTSSGKKIRAAYEKALAETFPTEKDQAVFASRMESGRYGKLNFMNTATDRYPCRLVAGPDYLIFFRDLNCRFIRVADIGSIYAQEEKSRIRLRTGDHRVIQVLTMGISLIVEYKCGSDSYEKKMRESLYLENGKQWIQAMELIRRYCPNSEKFMAESEMVTR